MTTAVVAEDRGGAAHREQDLGPDRPLDEFEALALPPCIEQPEDEPGAGDGGQHPAPERADRRQRPVAADQLEGLVHRGDRLAADQRPGDAAIGDEAAERDDEGRDAGIGGQHAVERSR